MLRADPRDRPSESDARAGRRKRRGKGGAGKPSAKPTRRRRGLRRFLVATLVIAIWIGVGLGAAVAWFAYDLPDVGRIAELTRRPNVTLVASDGSRLASFGDLYGETARVADLPPHVPLAVLAVEDRRFYEHPGIDFWGLARALYVNLRAGHIVQGGSTITQQLAKIMFLKPERTLKRKIQEAMLALWLEHRFSKPQILTLYLNRVYLGAGAYGIDAAAQRYFGVPARELSLYQAALLAGLLKAPSRYNPANDPDLADSRAQLVLAAMVEAGFIGEDAAGKATSTPRPLDRQRSPGLRYFADWVLGQVADYVGAIDRDLIVQTTLDGNIQRIAEEEVSAMAANEAAAAKAGQVAFVALTPDGAVRAMVGGSDYGESQFNRATQALRQPGSAFKPFVFLAALEQGFSPDQRMLDAPVEIAGWSPGNYGDRYYGEVTLREAFARSLNSVAVRLIQQVGPTQAAEIARRLGITSDLAEDASLALGTSEVTLLELTGAYAAFANQGYGVWPYAIAEIREPNGRILYRRSGGGPGNVMAPHQVNAMVDLMRATVSWGTGKGADPGRPAGGKTGTSQDFRDAWFIGFTAELVAGAWFGNDDGSPMERVTGGGLPARLWGRIMTRALRGLPPRPLPAADMVVAGDPTAPSPSSRATEGEGVGLIDRILRTLTLSSDEGSQPAQARPSHDGGPQR